MSYALYKTGSFANSGNITGGGGIEFSGSGSTLTNTATITGTSDSGVRLLNGGEVRGNYNSAIFGSYAGIKSDASAYVFNAGNISANVFGVIVAGGTVFNSGDGFHPPAHITGGLDGVNSSAYANVGNGYGTIYGGRFGVNLGSGGTISNDLGAISGGTTAVYVQGAIGNVTNDGNINGGLARTGDGVDLRAGGSVTNGSGNTIDTNGGRAVYSYADVSSGFVTNSGDITATSGPSSAGVYLRGNYVLNTAGGNVLNQAGGTISGDVGVSITDGGYVDNFGSISGNATTGVAIKGVGDVVNQGGSIYGLDNGVAITGNNGSVTNLGGSIVGYRGDGVVLDSGGIVTNSVSHGHRGSIYGYEIGILASGTPTQVVNSADITGFYTGIELTAGGTVTNKASGVIGGHTGGVLITGGNGTITNAGAIGGSSGYSVQFTGGGTDRLIVDPGAVFTGAVSGAGAHSTLELAKGASAGAITGLGTAFTGFAAINLDTGASWTASGTNSVVSSTAVTVKGALNVTGTTTLAGNVSGAGSISIASHAVLSVGGALGVAKLSFLAGGSETAVLGKPTSVSATIAGFAATDKIDVANFVVSGHTFSGTTLTLDHTGGSAAHLHFSSSYTGHHFAFASDGHGGTNISLV